MKMRDYRPLSIGIERGALKNAVLPYLSDLMRKNNVYSHIVDLTHGNRKKTDRVIWSLQGRFEHGRIVLNSEEDWDTFVDQLLMFPSQGVHDDLCFVAGTMISTPNGLTPIEQLRVNDMVDTPYGPRRVLAQRMTNAQAEVLSLNGQLVGTKNHPIMTNRGWIDLQNIREDDILVYQHKGVSSWVFQAKLAWSKSLFTLTATSTTGIQKLKSWLIRGISPKPVVAYCTGMFGNFTTEPSPQGITSTTKTAIGQTTTSPTWNVSASLHMGKSILSSAVQMRNGPSNWLTWPQSTTWQRLGTHLQKVWLGTKKTATQLGRAESPLSTPAKSAESSLNPSRRQRCISAVANALQRIGEKSTQTITPLKQRQSVYNLTVEHAHSYYANGILVHNCDALSYIDQLAVTSYFEQDDDDSWAPMDVISGV
jgi:hypothetical protein